MVKKPFKIAKKNIKTNIKIKINGFFSLNNNKKEKKSHSDRVIEINGNLEANIIYFLY